MPRFLSLKGAAEKRKGMKMKIIFAKNMTEDVYTIQLNTRRRHCCIWPPA